MDRLPILRIFIAGLLLISIFGLVRCDPPCIASEVTPAPVLPGEDYGLSRGDLNASKQAELEGIWRVLAVFLALSMLIESALTPLFNWRIFVRRFHDKGLRTPISMILAPLVVWGYDLDIIRDILVALGESAEPRLGGRGLTALLLSGGSSGVNQLLKTWKIRMSDGERSARASL